MATASKFAGSGSLVAATPAIMPTVPKVKSEAATARGDPTRVPPLRRVSRARARPSGAHPVPSRAVPPTRTVGAPRVDALSKLRTPSGQTIRDIEDLIKTVHATMAYYQKDPGHISPELADQLAELSMGGVPNFFARLKARRTELYRRTTVGARAADPVTLFELRSKCAQKRVLYKSTTIVGFFVGRIW